MNSKEIPKPIRDYNIVYKDFQLEDKVPEFEKFMTYISKFKSIDNKTKLFEVGTGNGWFQILCKKKGIECTGIDVVPENIEYAKKLAKKYNYEINIMLGGIESKEMKKLEYDIITAFSVFEHVRFWKKGLLNVYNALKPNGLLLFISTNKFSLISGEYKFPLYGWFPNKIRYQLRAWFQGLDTAQHNIDFNQFTYFHLRRFFKRLGFNQIYDIWDIIEEYNFENANFFKKYAVKFIKRSKLLKKLSLWFIPITFLICIK